MARPAGRSSARNPWNRVGLNGRTRRPSLDVPSGKNSRRCPARMRSARFQRLRAGQFRIARHEMRVGHARQDVDAGPAGDLGLADEEDRQGGVQRQDVQPAGMVRHDRAGAPRRGVPSRRQRRPMQLSTRRQTILDMRSGPGAAAAMHQSLDPAQRQDQQHAQHQHQNRRHAAADHPQPVAQPAWGGRHRRFGIAPGRAHVGCQRLS